MSMLITVQTLLITVAILLVVYELKQCIHIKLQNLEFVVLISQVFVLPGVLYCKISGRFYTLQPFVCHWLN